MFTIKPLDQLFEHFVLDGGLTHQEFYAMTVSELFELCMIEYMERHGQLKPV